MFNFDLKKTAIYKALKWEKIFCVNWLPFCKMVALLAFVVFLSLFSLGKLMDFDISIIDLSPSVFLGLIIFSLIWLITLLVVEAFFNLKLKKPALKVALKQALTNPEQYNLAQFLSFESARAVAKAIKKRGGEPSFSLLFYFLLEDNPKLNFVFARALLDVKKNGVRSIFSARKNRPDTIFHDTIFQKILLEALQIAVKKRHSRASVGDLLIALVKYNATFQKILIKANLKSRDIENLVNWLERIEQRISQRKKFWTRENLCRMGTIGRQWAAGYTLTLDKYSYDLTETVKWTLPEIVGHQKESEGLQAILSRSRHNNALLVGQPGTGRRSIIDALAVESLLGQSSPQVNYKRIVKIELPSLLAAASATEQVATILDKVFQEVVRAGNVILVIDEFHNFVGIEQDRPGAVDISGILSSYLHLAQFRLIALSTFAGLHKNIEQNPGLLSLFEKVEVAEISDQETFLLLQKVVPALEKIHKIIISYPALREVISLSDKYITSQPFPKKAMELLEAVFVYVARGTRDSIILPKHVAKIVTEKTEIPVGEIEAKEKEILLNLEKLVHQRLINQEEAVKEISEALRRARAGIAIRKGPMGGFLFLGPTGVGKTETAKTLADIYFGSEQRIIRLDMSEFQAVKDIPRLIGAPGEEGLLTTKVRERPFSLILLDELEKAHPDILNLFLQVLDEGHITDGQGRKVDFKNSIIIATSNAGFQIILRALKEKADWASVRQKILDYLFEKAIFRPEFINRFDAVVVFQPLSKENLLDIAQLMLQKLQKNLKEKHIDFVITEPLKEKLVGLGYSPTFGARQMRRVLQDKIENPLARALLSGQLKRGSKVEMDAKTFKLIIKS